MKSFAVCFFHKFKNYFNKLGFINKVRSVILSILILLIGLPSIAQVPLSMRDPKKKGIIYRKEFTFGAKIASNGWGVVFNTGKILNIKRTRLFEFELADIKHPKEKKQSAELGFWSLPVGSPKDFYYGKQNEFFTIRAGFGYRRNIAEKAEKNGVNLSLVYLGGISLGFLKPYYLDLAYPIDSAGDIAEVRSEKYGDNNNQAKFTNWYEIVGASGFGKGFKELEPVPGVYAKLALNFEFGSRDNFITALEGGFMADIYYKKVPIMINQDNNFLWMQAYLSLHIGKRKQ
ncbi:MAG: hypothetical protein SFW35_10050 [Chitinophagales bacterium]|nr:hypothetical protein [Chitinophagales bacterium]